MSGAPLAGLKVIDFTRVLAGPYCTKLLRDLGAEIIKLEPPSGDVGRVSFPHVGPLSTYYTQLNAGKKTVSVDLNWAEGRELVQSLVAEADILVENFRPGTLDRFGFGYRDVSAYNPRIIYASMTGYGQSTSWRNRPAFAPTIQAETGLTDIVATHFGEDLSAPYGDACSHADLYTGLQGLVGILAALRQRDQTGKGQAVDVSMAATMLSVNERAGAQLNMHLDTYGEPIALAAPDSHIFVLPDGSHLTIAASPVFTPIFMRYCGMMRRNDLMKDPRFLTPQLRKENLKALLMEVRNWLLTFTDLQQLQTQVSEAGLAVGVVRSTSDLAKSDWAAEWGAVVQVDDRAGGTMSMPGNPWQFSDAELPAPGVPSFQGEHNRDVFGSHGVKEKDLEGLRERGVLLSRRHPLDPFE